MSEELALIKVISARLVKFLAAWTAIAILIISVFSLVFHWIPVLVVTLACGVLGGFISLQRRLKTFGVPDLHLLAESWYYTLLAPSTGGFLAVVLYAVFISELLKGGLFPAFTLDASDAAKPGTVVFQDIMLVHAVTVQDYAKLLVWSFIAGFSEKFVINILGQFHGRGLDGTTDDGHPPQQP